MTWPPVLSQRTYPGAGDVDDCWVVATVWAAIASVPGIRRPTVTEYRRHAGDPDDGFQDGGSLDEVVKGARGSWPDLDVTRWQSTNWESFAALVKAQHPASLAVDSGDLPVGHRYGFTGKHQIGVAWDAARRTFVVANPLAADGSAPKPIQELSLRIAALGLIPSLREVRAAIFPVPATLPDTGTGDDMVELFSMPESDGPYPATVDAGTPVYASATDTTASHTHNDAGKPFTVVGAASGNVKATTGRRWLYGHYSGVPVRLGCVDVSRINR